MKNIFILLVISFAIIFSFVSWAYAWVLDDIFDIQDEANNPYLDICDVDDQDCLKRGVDQVRVVEWIVTDRSASDYIQDVIVYLLGFSYFIVTVLIIYAGFLYITANGDEEKTKTSRKIIMYSIFGIIIIFLAWPIARFLFEVFLPSAN